MEWRLTRFFASFFIVTVQVLLLAPLHVGMAQADQYAFQRLQELHEARALYSVSVRLRMLRQLRGALLQREEDVAAALWADLRKSAPQARLTELLPVVQELDYFIRNLRRFARPRRVRRNMACLTARAVLVPEPAGPSLVVAPFNYPFQLAMAPLVGCLAAGCPCLVCLPASVPATRAAVRALLDAAGLLGDACYVYPRDDYAFLPEKFACVFFTGSTRVGRHVYGLAAQNLSRVVLELGGANPLLVCDDVAGGALQQCCRQIVMAKFTNAGQTCIAPNYAAYAGGAGAFRVFISRVGAALLGAYGGRQEHLCCVNAAAKYAELRALVEKYGADGRLTALLDDKLSRDVSEVLSFIDARAGERLFPPCLLEVGNDADELYDEIFGPILFVTRFDSLEDFLVSFKARYQGLAKPLAAYVFTTRRQRQARFHESVRAGCVSVNQALMHIVSNLPFGGFGESGLYAYHGRASFDFFTFAQPRLVQGYGCAGRAFLRVQDALALPPYRRAPLRVLRLLGLDAALLWLLLLPAALAAALALALCL